MTLLHREVPSQICVETQPTILVSLSDINIRNEGFAAVRKFGFDEITHIRIDTWAKGYLLGREPIAKFSFAPRHKQDVLLFVGIREIERPDGHADDITRSLCAANLKIAANG
ncbi:MAG: hypothetical protein ACI92Z_000962, partial [Paracoccaceae bacterium]